MSDYKAPLRDIHFVMNELLDYQNHYQTLSCGENIDEELMEAILSSVAEFAEKLLAPIYESADKEECSFKDGKVTTPTGFKKAYDEFVAGGWPGLSQPEEFGGQGLPSSLNAVVNEIIASANWSWLMYPGLSHGAIHTIEAHGTPQQKQRFLPKLVEGTWSGTMCLTESHCGSDLGQVAPKAVPKDDGSYAITGQKIFISAGDHDLTENIIHVVLARLPDAPEGTKGISLFLVPKIKLDEDGNPGEANQVSCSSIEKKMGIKASATCVMDFDDATGYLIGPENRGLNCMFTFINISRLGNAIQGIATAELAYQKALPYARERLSMRSLSGVKAPDKPADPIIVHPDVRRMLLTIKCIAEGGRAMLYDAAMIGDHFLHNLNETEKKKADDRLSLLTPILKGFLTEMGCEAANQGIQVLGGHGYIWEMGMEQVYRDVRISTIYEGTTGIQALDLLGRKVMLSRGKVLIPLLDVIRAFCGRYGAFSRGIGRDMRMYTKVLAAKVRQWDWTTKRLMLRARKNRDVVGCAAYDYLMYSGYIVMGWYWARMAEVALTRLAEPDTADQGFYRAKLQTANFYFQRMLPRTRYHHAAMTARTDGVMDISDEDMMYL